MQGFQIGRIDGPWQNFLPPIQGGQFEVCADLQDLNDPPFDSLEATAGPREEQVAVPCIVSKHFTEQPSQEAPAVGTLPAACTEGLSPEDASTRLVRSAVDAASEAYVEFDLQKYPSLHRGVQSDIVQRYRALDERISEAGLYHCRYSAYGVESLRYVMLFLASMVFLRLGWYGTSGAILGMFWHQLVFTAHDAGHMGITHGFHTDTIIGIIIADYIGGLSLGWWKRNHNVHHVVTNSPEHDPDIEHMPFFAITPRFFSSLHSTYYDRVMKFDWAAKWAIRCQHYLYYPLLTLGRFNLYVHSWTFLLLGQGPRKGPAWWHRWFEIAGQVFFWTWYGYGIVYRGIPNVSGRVVFVLVSHMITGPLHVQITLSHFAMSTADLGVNESFPQKMLRTTMDVDCPEWLDFFHGGLQFQAIHHLYPRMPRHNLRKAQELVRAFCRDVGIPYTLYGFARGNQKVIGRLSEVSRQVQYLAECQKSLVDGSVVREKFYSSSIGCLSSDHTTL